ncbi:Methyl-accepting chemotaxis protein II [Paraburkholderia tropica]|uniref:methyl-accepting chemotaxis protein n=1 Tax=Paraburkholderia TaxID=1822464 RepID=UPI001CAE001B|nr:MULTISPECIES: methyl-accepting chemotaxis protein [Paraburkholderia]CAG9238899.1 Methyl-accepting chemotaxis protein II [Paraburkholderia tropica]
MLNNLRIGSRLALGFGLSMLLVFLLGVVSLWQMKHVYAGAEDLAENWLPSVQALGAVDMAANSVRRLSLRALIETSDSGVREQKRLHDEAVAQFSKRLDDYRKMISSDQEAALARDIDAQWKTYLDADNRLIDYAMNGAGASADARALALGPASVAFTALGKAISDDKALNAQGGQDARASAQADYHFALLTTWVTVIVALICGASAAWLITRSITIPVAKAVHMAETVAQGDLTGELAVEGRDEAARLLQALSEMNRKLGSIVTRVRESADGIATASGEIAAGNIDLSQRTEEQAASLQESAASMEELTSTVRQNAENAAQGDRLAAGASEVAIKGGEVVGRVVETMGHITNSAEKMADIISVIEGIAFQTNILALNAAVEAARAGEQGRGFAVVAGEVRSLAQRSAAAAREIKGLIDDSVGTVKRGGELVSEAGSTIREVVTSVRRVTDLMGEISSASNEQHKGIEQVNQAVTQMDEVTQQNAALVEQAAAAAQSMAGQAATLKELVSFFRVSSAQQEAAPVQIAQRRAAPVARTPAPKRAVRPTPQPVVERAAERNDKEWETF